MYQSTSNLLQLKHLHECYAEGAVAHISCQLHAQTLQVAVGGNGVLQHPEV